MIYTSTMPASLFTAEQSSWMRALCTSMFLAATVSTFGFTGKYTTRVWTILAWMVVTATVPACLFTQKYPLLMGAIFAGMFFTATTAACCFIKKTHKFIFGVTPMSVCLFPLQWHENTKKFILQGNSCFFLNSWNGKHPF